LRSALRIARIVFSRRPRDHFSQPDLIRPELKRAPSY
jgi:hypothetical protein